MVSSVIRVLHFNEHVRHTVYVFVLHEQVDPTDRPHVSRITTVWWAAHERAATQAASLVKRHDRGTQAPPYLRLANQVLGRHHTNGTR